MPPSIDPDPAGRDSADKVSAESGSGVVIVTPALLREWPLPAPGTSKYDRGQIVVVGGARRTPGAAMLAAEAALRVGAGRLTVALARSVAISFATGMPECGVVELDETEDGHVLGTSIDRARNDLRGADAVLVGPGLDASDEALTLVDRLPGLVGADATVVLDAFALGVLPRSTAARAAFAGRLVLTPNLAEAGRLLDAEIGADDDLDQVALAVAREYSATVSCQGRIAHPDGRAWRIGTGHGGLGTSGSGDVLAGAIAGLCARGAAPEAATVWATHAHAAAGDRLAVRVGPLGFLARELLGELPRVLVEIG